MSAYVPVAGGYAAGGALSIVLAWDGFRMAVKRLRGVTFASPFFALRDVWPGGGTRVTRSVGVGPCCVAQRVSGRATFHVYKGPEPDRLPVWDLKFEWVVWRIEISTEETVTSVRYILSRWSCD